MESDQATLPFVVPSHLSKLFGLKASVIVEGERAGVRDGGAGWANSTCWGDGETAVTREGWKRGVGGGGKHKSRLFFLLFCLPVFFFSAASDRKH